MKHLPQIENSMHAVHRLYQYRKSLSTTTFQARGKGVNRCECCRLAKENCLCAMRVSLQSDAAFLLLMYDTEVLKPSNTGKLIADLLPDCYAFLWARTEVPDELLNVINNDQYQPYVVFPAEFADQDQQVFQQSVTVPIDKRPLFILLDGSWREAKKMFRKSDYLKQLPVLSIDPQRLYSKDYTSKYHIRHAAKASQLATAEVAAMVLNGIGEHKNGETLAAWFDYYSYQYQKSVCQANQGDPFAEQRYKTLIMDVIEHS
ncbi:tRNA-uridine aminocarboxypropyltransferase [Thalassotalea sp. G2M2-11]|uniref:tRNA-uridine aminocarboxypropyltransferase n=1 Tax=Thalassotalea sp. G2M2-11 TaxID=2787627 RepID=UPI001F4989D9|nr:tRNA-uridine aminocarboxypropyltransferase [Thalassotalea sp. G2M2-11]